MTTAMPTPAPLTRTQFVDSLLPGNSLSTAGNRSESVFVAGQNRGAYAQGMISALAERVASMLDRRGLTQGELSESAGIDPSILSRLLSGKRSSASAQTIARMARTLQVSSGWLATGEGDADRAEGGETQDRFPERAKALRAARELGLHPRALEFVAALYLPNGENFDAKWWLDMLLTADKKLREGKSVP